VSNQSNDEMSSYIQRVQQNVARHSHELLRENERLRLQLAQTQQQLADTAAENLRREREAMELEQQHANLTTLYVASFRLHSTLEREEVLSAIQEIVINLVGCEELAIFETGPQPSRLTLAASFGIDAAQFHSLPTDRGRIGHAVRTAETWVRGEATDPGATPHERHLTAVVPLVLADKVTGAIALFRLLQHKNGIEAVDRELFELLGTHAAMALHTTSLTAAACSVA
jgi:nitrate/nitrite-specific signal transduction histidine kinase